TEHGLDLLLAHAGRDLRQLVLFELVAVLGDGLGAGCQRHGKQRRACEATQARRCRQTNHGCASPASLARVGLALHDQVVPRESVVPSQMIGYRNAGHFAMYLIHPPPNRATPAEAGKPKKKRQMLAWLKTM